MDHKDAARLLAEAEANCSPLPPNEFAPTVLWQASAADVSSAT